VEVLAVDARRGFVDVDADLLALEVGEADGAFRAVKDGPALIAAADGLGFDLEFAGEFMKDFAGVFVERWEFKARLMSVCRYLFGFLLVRVIRAMWMCSV
jgi:hypothetical protein